MNSQTRRAKLFEVLVLTLLGVLMYVTQVILAPLPNIETVSLLIIIATCVFGVKALCSVYIFVICEIFTYGFHIWSINYLYVWTILCLAVLLTRKVANPLFFALLSAIFGLLFGTFCSIPYFFTGGIAAGIGYIIQGFVYDLLHCAGNFFVAILLFLPLKNVLEKTVKKHL